MLWYARPGLYKGVFTFRVSLNMRQLNVIYYERDKNISISYIYVYINIVINI